MALPIRPLTHEEISARDAGLELACTLAGKPRPLSAADLQGVYNALMAERLASGDAAIALGLACAELLVVQFGMEWVRIEDEHGSETVVSPPGKDIFCAPISMIQKRLRRGEPVDVGALMDGVGKHVAEKIADGQVHDR